MQYTSNTIQRVLIKRQSTADSVSGHVYCYFPPVLGPLIRFSACIKNDQPQDSTISNKKGKEKLNVPYLDKVECCSFEFLLPPQHNRHHHKLELGWYKFWIWFVFHFHNQVNTLTNFRYHSIHRQLDYNWPIGQTAPAAEEPLKNRLRAA